MDLAQQLKDVHHQELIIARASHAAAFYEHLLAEMLAEQNRFSSVTVFAHSEFCSEEMESEKALREVLRSIGSSSAVPCELKTFWGGLTVHHKEDLERHGMAGANFPLFKGQYNSGAKKCGVRHPCGLPDHFKPSMEISSIGLLERSKQGTEAAISAIFDTYYLANAAVRFWAGCSPSGQTAAVPYSRENEFEHRWKGGETVALAYIEDFFNDGQKLHAYRGAGICMILYHRCHMYVGFAHRCNGILRPWGVGKSGDEWDEAVAVAGLWLHFGTSGHQARAGLRAEIWEERWWEGSGERWLHWHAAAHRIELPRFFAVCHILPLARATVLSDRPV